VQYAADFAEILDLERAILTRLRAAGVPAEQYDKSTAFSADWSSVDFMAVSALKDKMDSYVLHLCSQLPDVVALSSRTSGLQIASIDLYKLLEANMFDLDAAAAAAQVRGSSVSSQNCMDAFDRDPEVQDAIAQAEREIARDVYPDFHLILGPENSTDSCGRLYLSNERFVGHVGAYLPGSRASSRCCSFMQANVMFFSALFERDSSSPLGHIDDPAEAAHKNLADINCNFIVSCVDRPKLLEDRGYQYCQIPLGDTPSAAAELPGLMREAFAFIDGAR
jgi:hypothetical protein